MWRTGVVLLALVVTVGAVPAARADRSAWPQTLRFGMIVTESGTMERWQGVMSYLEKRLGVQVRGYVGTDYTATVIAAKNKDIEAGWLGPESYVLATKQGAQISAVVKGMKNGLAGYHSLLITRADSGIKTMADAKGRTFAFNDPASTSGYLMPMIHFLKDMNVKPDQYFSKVAFLGSHENTALAVATGKVDLSSNNDLNMNALFTSGRVKKDDIRILWTSATIPSDPIWVQNGLPEDLKAAIQDAFLKIADETPEAVHTVGWDKWIKATDADYNVIRALNADKERLLSH